MRIAIPVVEGKLSPHFGHCREFHLVDADAESKKITNTTIEAPPAHEPGVLPRWLHEHGADVIIAGGMGQRAQMLFQQAGIQVVVGTPVADPRDLVQAFLDGTLESGTNICDH